MFILQIFSHYLDWSFSLLFKLLSTSREITQTIRGYIKEYTKKFSSLGSIETLFLIQTVSFFLLLLNKRIIQDLCKIQARILKS
jgi:hypothetical protein